MKMVRPDYRGKNKGHYSAGVISHGLLFVSGQLSIDPDTREVAEGGVEEHMKQALSNLERVVKEAGLSKNDVVQCRLYVSNIEDWDLVNRVYADFFGDHQPARIVLPVDTLHFGCLVEVEAVAEFPEE